jgi:HAD superfamily hydrolase (TIGR01490 family)
MTQSTEPSSIAIFDLDRTVTRIGTFTPLCLYAAWKNNPLRLICLPLVIGILVTTGLKLTTRKTLKTWLLAMLIGPLSRTRLEETVSRFIDAIWDRQVRPAALKTIEDERAQGARLYLATASYDFCAEQFARRLGFDGCIATRSLWKQDRLVAGIDGENCYGQEKLDRITSHLSGDGILSENQKPAITHSITMYSDDRSDLPSLLWADRAVVVNPKPKFEKIAKASALEVVYW